MYEGTFNNLHNSSNSEKFFFIFNYTYVCVCICPSVCLCRSMNMCECSCPQSLEKGLLIPLELEFGWKAHDEGTRM